jgi:hypothetical protein
VPESAPAPAGLARPRLTARLRPARDRRAPYGFRVAGRLVVPGGVSASDACRGAVSVQVRLRDVTLSTRRARLRRDCTWSSSVTFARARAGRLEFSVRFFGNARLSGAASRVLGRVG